MLNDDGVILEVNEKHLPNGLTWADQADKDIATKMNFWWNVTEQAACKIAKTKAIVIHFISFQEFLSKLQLVYNIN